MSTGPGLSAKQAARKATQAALLDAATAMLLESPGKDLLRGLKPVDVVRRADPQRTTGAFYNIWPTQEAFRRDLLDHLLSLDRFGVDQATREALAQFLTASEFDLDETVRVAANMNYDGLRRDPAFRIQRALWTDAAVDEAIRTRVRGLYDDIKASLTPLYVGILARSHRQMRSGFTVENLGVALAALVEGLHVRWAVDPDSVPDEMGAPPGVDVDSPAYSARWSFFASITYLLLMSMTEPETEPAPKAPH